MMKMRMRMLIVLARMMTMPIVEHPAILIAAGTVNNEKLSYPFVGGESQDKRWDSDKETLSLRGGKALFAILYKRTKSTAPFLLC
jgi:hypothetical protein